MELYKNDYTKEEDFMLWQLHEIRNKISKQGLSSEQINEHGREIISQFNLKNLNFHPDNKPDQSEIHPG